MGNQENSEQIILVQYNKLYWYIRYLAVSMTIHEPTFDRKIR